MSRCFPFPPPGYEKKPIADEPDLLKKEKRKEKKHKKDKKDKERKDGKEKKDKDRSEGKHKEKKDKKDKHRDKNKDKEKSKSSTPDEKKIYGQFEGCNGEKFHHNNEQNKDKISSSSDRKQSLQFQNGGDKRSPLQFTGQNGELVRNRSRGGDPENNKFVQELDRRIRDEEKGMGSHQFVGEGRKFSVNKVEIQKMGGQQLFTDGVVGFSGNPMVAGNPMVGGNPTIQNKINGSTPPFLDHRRIEQKGKIQEKENDDKRGDKRKHKDRDKQRQEKDKDTEKVKKDKKDRKEERSKEKSEQKKAERDKNKHIKKSDPITAPNSLPAHSLETSFQGVGSEGIHKKRKDMESNGVFHENEPRPNKMARHISNFSPENGRRINFPQSPSSSLLDKQGASQGASPNSFKVGNKGQRVNGMIVSQPDLVPAKKPSVSPFNHLPTKPSLIKSPPVITNHVTAQSPPVPTTKPQPNNIAARLSSPKPPPSIPNPVTQTPPRSSTSPLVPRPKPPPAVVNKVATAPPPPTHFNKVAAPPMPVPKKKPPVPVEPPVKPPHPDTKYLSRILTVPKLDQWCGDDNQEWLFNSKEGPTSKKPPTEDPQVQVWSEAKHIESVDVCALPYVIPY
ncbi:hypothetical protein CTI12_AA220490 [Artemisia annua]|uniref:Uncharacterized protein n=1 Tax=Artemisia annua TaxID=35608 RepID=A0A2U1NWI5_ARTAN|nr:hypothetical protein CTI12_AA220490 [Artemisia annua]